MKLLHNRPNLVSAKLMLIFQRDIFVMTVNENARNSMFRGVNRNYFPTSTGFNAHIKADVLVFNADDGVQR